MCSRGQLGTLPKSCHLHEARGPTTAHAGWPLEYKGEAEVASEARGRSVHCLSHEALGSKHHRSPPRSAMRRSRSRKRSSWSKRALSQPRSFRLKASSESSAKCNEAKPKWQAKLVVAAATFPAATLEAVASEAHGRSGHFPSSGARSSRSRKRSSQSQPTTSEQRTAPKRKPQLRNRA